VSLGAAATALGVTPGRLVPGDSPTAFGRDDDAVALALMSDRAGRRARRVARDAVLREVDVYPTTGRITFRFADATATHDFAVAAPGLTAPEEQWEVSRSAPGYLVLLGHPLPGLDLGALRVGPERAARAVAAYRSDWVPQALVLGAWVMTPHGSPGPRRRTGLWRGRSTAARDTGSRGHPEALAEESPSRR
jgi:hypothetical protein